MDARPILPAAACRAHPIRAADYRSGSDRSPPAFGEPPSEEVCSCFYDSAGNTLDYVYELTENTLTIWAGAKGGPAYYRGEFSADDQTLSGDWVYPGGGGYTSTMTRS